MTERNGSELGPDGTGLPEDTTDGVAGTGAGDAPTEQIQSVSDGASVADTDAPSDAFFRPPSASVPLPPQEPVRPAPPGPVTAALPVIPFDELPSAGPASAQEALPETRVLPVIADAPTAQLPQQGTSHPAPRRQADPDAHTQQLPAQAPQGDAPQAHPSALTLPMSAIPAQPNPVSTAPASPLPLTPVSESSVSENPASDQPASDHTASEPSPRKQPSPREQPSAASPAPGQTAPAGPVSAFGRSEAPSVLPTAGEDAPLPRTISRRVRRTDPGLMRPRDEQARQQASADAAAGMLSSEATGQAPRLPAQPTPAQPTPAQPTPAQQEADTPEAPRGAGAITGAAAAAVGGAAAAALPVRDAASGSQEPLAPASAAEATAGLTEKTPAQDSPASTPQPSSELPVEEVVAANTEPTLETLGIERQELAQSAAETAPRGTSIFDHLSVPGGTHEPVGPVTGELSFEDLLFGPREEEDAAAPAPHTSTPPEAPLPPVLPIPLPSEGVAPAALVPSSEDAAPTAWDALPDGAALPADPGFPEPGASRADQGVTLDADAEQDPTAEIPSAVAPLQEPAIAAALAEDAESAELDAFTGPSTAELTALEREADERAADALAAAALADLVGPSQPAFAPDLFALPEDLRGAAASTEVQAAESAQPLDGAQVPDGAQPVPAPQPLPAEQEDPFFIRDSAPRAPRPEHTAAGDAELGDQQDAPGEDGFGGEQDGLAALGLDTQGLMLQELAPTGPLPLIPPFPGALSESDAADVSDTGNAHTASATAGADFPAQAAAAAGGAAAMSVPALSDPASVDPAALSEEPGAPAGPRRSTHSSLGAQEAVPPVAAMPGGLGAAGSGGSDDSGGSGGAGGSTPGGPGKNRSRWVAWGLVAAVGVALLGFGGWAGVRALNAPEATPAPSPVEPTPEPTTPEPTPEPESVRVIAMGDQLTHDSVNANALQPDGTYNYGQFFDGIRPLLENSDVTFCNQEVPSAGIEFGISGYPTFNAPAEFAGDLSGSVGCDLVNLATNHAADKGVAGIAATRAVWDELDPMAIAGANRTAEEQREVQYTEVNGVKIAFVAYAEYSNANVDGVSLNFMSDEALVTEQITEARENADTVIVSAHWGTEDSPVVNEQQQAFAQRVADLGADVVLGTGPHVIQPVSWLDRADGGQTLVWYSLGNMLNTQLTLEQRLGAVASFELVREGESVRVEAPEAVLTYMHYDWTAEAEAAGNLLARTNLTITPLADSQELLDQTRFGANAEELSAMLAERLGPDVTVNTE